MKKTSENFSDFERELFPSVQEEAPKGPFASISWNATTVYMEVHCECGETTHIETDFCYHIKCVKCGRAYECDPRIRLLPLRVQPPSAWNTESD